MDAVTGGGTNKLSGALVVDKPTGMTSHDVVEVIRKGTHIRRAGHTGTLDPRASGVLVVLLGPAVRLSEYVSASDKRYQAVVRLGESTDTYDADGVVTKTACADEISEADFVEALESFRGTIKQVPPAYSAIKMQGRKAYDLARRGEEVHLEPRNVEVYSLELVEWSPPEVVIDVFCASGTYVRSLAHDLGEKLGCGAHLTGLRRTMSGHFTLRDAVPLALLREEFETGGWHRHLIPAAETLPDWATLELDEGQVERVRYGNAVQLPALGAALARGISSDGDLIAVMEFDAEKGIWIPRKVFYH